jgi:hypothetical protein
MVTSSQINIEWYRELGSVPPENLQKIIKSADQGLLFSFPLQYVNILHMNHTLRTIPLQRLLMLR